MNVCGKNAHRVGICFRRRNGILSYIRIIKGARGKSGSKVNRNSLRCALFLDIVRYVVQVTACHAIYHCLTSQHTKNIYIISIYYIIPSIT